MRIVRVQDSDFNAARMAAMAMSLEPKIGDRIAQRHRSKLRELERGGGPKVEVGSVDLIGLTELVGDELLGADVATLLQRIGAAKNARGGVGSPGPASAGHLGVVEREATRARDYPIGFDSVATVAATAASTLSATPQVVFKPQRLIIPAAIADNFVITDLKVGKNSQLAATGNIPAATFVAGAFDVKLNLDTCQIAMGISLSVTNISGAAVRFLACMIGPAVE